MWAKCDCSVFFADERHVIYSNSMINVHFRILSLSYPVGAETYRTGERTLFSLRVAFAILSSKHVSSRRVSLISAINEY
jgi:hypothetical protein